MANALAVNLAILPSYRWDGKINGKDNYTPDNKPYSFLNKEKTNALSKDEVAQMSKAMPDIFRSAGGIDVRSVANKAKRLELQRRDKLIKILEDFEKNGNEPKATTQWRNYY